MNNRKNKLNSSKNKLNNKKKLAFSTNVKCNLSYRIIPSQKKKKNFDQIKKPIQRKN